MSRARRDDRWPELTEAERRSIAEIRRKIDAELQQKLDADFGPVDTLLQRPARHHTRRRVLVATMALGVLAGTVLGVVGTASRLRHADPEHVASDTRGASTPRESKSERAVTPWVVVDDAALLRDAVDEWIEATRRGDVTTQMQFYPASVPVYYTWRNVPRDAVRAEKVKVFGAARRLVITTGVPAVEVADDGRSAVTRFRKAYVIEGPTVRRRGEVLQELRWTRTTQGWLIVGERDARVLRSG